MRFVVQRVTNADVTVDNEIIGKINKGYMVLIGIKQGDTTQEADYLIRKLINLRVFEDENEKMNLSIKDVNGEMLLISQFTLYGDCTNGNRPSFIEAEKPDKAEELYEYIIEQCKKEISKVEKGKFGAHMKINLVNDGPVTIMLER